MVAQAIGGVALVRPGCEVWSKTRHYTSHGEVMPVGGIVLFEDVRFDPEAGGDERRFLVLDQYRTRPRLHWAWILELDVDPSTAQTVDIKVLVNLWRRLAEEIAFSSTHHRRRGPATAQEARWAEAVLVLIRLVFGPEGLLHGEMESPKLQDPAEPRPSAPPAVSALMD